MLRYEEEVNLKPQKTNGFIVIARVPSPLSDNATKTIIPSV